MTKILTGKVVSTGKMDKTIVVEIESFRKHPLYKKIVRRSKKLLVHMEKGETKIGDKIKIQEIRPMSKSIHFEVLGVNKK